MSRLIVGFGAALLLAGCQTTNPNASWGRVGSFDRAALSGDTIRVDGFYQLTKDCKNFGYARLRVISASGGGRLTSRSEMSFPAYAASNPYAVCNSKRSPTTAVYYTAPAGFKGQDNVQFEIYWKDGDVWTYTLNVSVR